MEDRIYEMLDSISNNTKNKKVRHIIDYIQYMITEISCGDYNDWESFLESGYSDFIDVAVKDIENIIDKGAIK